MVFTLESSIIFHKLLIHFHLSLTSLRSADFRSVNILNPSLCLSNHTYVAFHAENFLEPLVLASN
jgi:hypothetical protein